SRSRWGGARDGSSDGSLSGDGRLLYGVRFADHEYWHRRMAQDGLGHRAKQQPPDSGSSVRGHGDEVGAAFLRPRQNLMGRTTAPDRPARVHALRSQRRRDGREVLLGFVPTALEVIDDNGTV